VKKSTGRHSKTLSLYRLAFEEAVSGLLSAKPAGLSEKAPRRPEHGPTPAEMELLDRIEARLEDTSPGYRRCRFPAASKRGGDGTRRCDMIPTVAVCV
jgi:hypothetical protein